MQTYNDAKGILGDNFVSPLEIDCGLNFPGIRYSPEHLGNLAVCFPRNRTLQELKRNNYGLVPEPLSKQFLDLTVVKDADYLHYEGFRGSWIAIKMGPIPGSGFKTFFAQNALVRTEEHEYVPTAIELLWFILLFEVFRGKQNLFPQYVRTATLVSPLDAFHRVLVSQRVEKNGELLSVRDNFSGIGVGLAVARRV